MNPTSADEISGLVDRARSVTAAVAATPDDGRAQWLRTMAAALDGRADDLVALADGETALGESRLRGEVARTSGQLRLFADVIAEGSYVEAIIDNADPKQTVPRPDLRRMLRPLGPVGVFSASNFPFAFSVAGGDTASALAAGCPVIVKAHPGHEQLSRLTANIVGDALQECGAPDGTFALISGFEAGSILIDHPALAAAAFTGSLSGGRALLNRANARATPIPFFAEMGSVNPVIVTRAADRARGDELAVGLARSFQLGAGQFCTKPGIVFVPEGSRLEPALASLISREGSRMLTPSIADGFHQGIDKLLSRPGIDVVAGSDGSERSEGQPVVLAVPFRSLAENPEHLLEEVFGPVTVLVRYSDEDEIRAGLQLVRGSLTVTIHSEKADDLGELLRSGEQIAGRVLFDGWPTGVSVTWSQNHGGPWPATNSQHTSVGATAIRRFQRPIAYQNAPHALLPAALRDENPLGIIRRVDGLLTRTSGEHLF